MSKFRRDLAIGEMAEKEVCKILEKAGMESTKNKDRSTDISVLIGNRIFYGEVKFDILAYKTGNMAVEYANSRTGMPSGILSTTSDFWFAVLGDIGKKMEVWICSTEALKNHFQQNKGYKDVEGAGDGNATIRLFRLDTVLDSLFTRIDNLSVEEVRKEVAKVVKWQNPNTL